MVKTISPMDEVWETLPVELKDYVNVFIKRPVGQLPIRKPWDHMVDLKEGFKPQRGWIILLLQEDIQKIKEFIEENLKKGFIRPSKSPQTALILFIPKKDTTEKWMITDYHYLNKWMIPNTYPLPLVSQLLDSLHGCDMFTKMDVRWGYNNI